MDARLSWPQPEQKCDSYMRFSKAWETFTGLHPSMYGSHRRSMVNGDRKTDTPDSSKETSDSSYKDDKLPSTNSSQVDSNLTLRRKKENKANTNSVESCRFFDASFIPWKPDDKTYPNTTKGLHEEIIAFVEYMAPSPAEHFMRERVVNKIRNVIQVIWPHAKMEVFGSFRTRLYLPTSDIDIMILGNQWENPPLRLLEKELIERGVCDQENVRVLDKASVPIVKVIDLETEVRVDISFNVKNSTTIYATQSADMIQGFIQEFPVLRPLVLVLKQFLLQRDLNEAYTGGISSYCLLLMVYSFLQQQRSDVFQSPNANLGELLIEFFEFYGTLFNYLTTAIRIGPPGCYLPKEEAQKTLDNGHRPSLLCIQDPLQEGNDIGRSSYGVLTVKQVFQNAYITLRTRLIPEDRHICEQATSILACIVRVTDEVVDYRQSIENKFASQITSVPQGYITAMPNPNVLGLAAEETTEGMRGMWMRDDDMVSSSTSSGGSSGALSDVESEAAVEVVNTRNSRDAVSATSVASSSNAFIRRGNANMHATTQQHVIHQSDQAAQWSKNSPRSEARSKNTSSPRSSDVNTRKYDSSSPHHKDTSSPAAGTAASAAHSNDLLPAVTDQLTRLSRHSRAEVSGHSSSNAASHAQSGQHTRTNTNRQPHSPQQQQHHAQHRHHHPTTSTSSMNGIPNHESSAQPTQGGRSAAQHRSSHSHAVSSSSGSSAVTAAPPSTVSMISSFGASAAHSRSSHVSSHVPSTTVTATPVSSSLTISVTSPSFPPLSGSVASPSSSSVIASHSGRATASASVTASPASPTPLGTPSMTSQSSAAPASIRLTGNAGVSTGTANRRRRNNVGGQSNREARMNGHSGDYSSSSDTAR